MNKASPPYPLISNAQELAQEVCVLHFILVIKLLVISLFKITYHQDDVRVKSSKTLSFSIIV